jgi:U-box domain
MDETPSEFICPLTLCIMNDPIMVIWGSSFERSAIFKWIMNGNQTCPLTRRELHIHDLVTNYALKHKIQQWKQDKQREIVTEIDATDYFNDSSNGADDDDHSDILRKGIIQADVNKESLFRILAHLRMNEENVQVDHIVRLFQQIYEHQNSRQQNHQHKRDTRKLKIWKKFYSLTPALKTYTKK